VALLSLLAASVGATESPLKSGPCADSEDFCSSWADHGECTNNPTFMHRHCPVSCNTCTPNAEEVFEDVDADEDGKISHAELLERLKLVEAADKARYEKHESDPKTVAERAKQEKDTQLLMRELPLELKHNKPPYSDEAEKYRVSFAALDTDNDGNLSMAEAWAQEHAQMEGNSVEAREIKQMEAYEAARFKKSDLDGDGVLSMQEFIYNRNTHFPELDNLLQDDVSEEADRIMKRLDTNGDGALDPSEVTTGQEKDIEVLHEATHPEGLRDEL
jgi:Ca2+-binding EF-hand superfamily protein